MSGHTDLADRQDTRRATGNVALLDVDDRWVLVDNVLAKHGYQKSELIGVLQEVQKEFNYLPEEVLTYIAAALRMAPASVFGVATFYAQFSLEPKGKYVVRVCDGTACHVRDSEGICAALRRRLNLSGAVFTTPDRLFTLEIVRCLGACGIAPVMVVNEQVHPQLTPEAAVAIVDALIEREAEAGGNEVCAAVEVGG
jgi:NADH-quinone oxidoreductase subunit E